MLRGYERHRDPKAHLVAIAETPTDMHGCVARYHSHNCAVRKGVGSHIRALIVARHRG